MAMLAEPRRKQKISVNPNGLEWSKDDSKFGQKMLEKMGWKNGKGLGANEDGSTSHITTRVKIDNKGVGCTKKNADNWIAHQDDFNSILTELQAVSGSASSDEPESRPESAIKVGNLEHRSKSSRSRIHYKKFTKGKDLSRAKTEDLDCIFGKRKVSSNPDTPQPLSEVVSDDDCSPPDTQNTIKDGLNTFNSNQSAQDYFAKKMEEIKKRQATKQGESDYVECVEAENESQTTQKEKRKKPSDQPEKNDVKHPPVETKDNPMNKKEKKLKKGKKKNRSKGGDELMVDHGDHSNPKKRKNKISDVTGDNVQVNSKEVKQNILYETLEDKQGAEPEKKKRKKDKMKLVNKDKISVNQVDTLISKEEDQCNDVETNNDIKEKPITDTEKNIDMKKKTTHKRIKKQKGELKKIICGNETGFVGVNLNDIKGYGKI